MQRLDVEKQMMPGDLLEVADAHVWRDVHRVGDVVDISSAGLRALTRDEAFARP